MSDFMEQLWSQFAIETQEHIEEIELRLVEAEHSGAAPELLATLFRAFHSLKSLATAMNMHSFARVAHRAEDILGVIRTGEFPLNGDVIALLLKALDEIKHARYEAVTTKTNAYDNPALLDALSETFIAMEQTVKPDVIDVPAGPLTNFLLPSDPEMLSYFIELARERVSSISHILEPVFSSTQQFELHNYQELADRSTVEIDQLEYAARTMEFFRLVTILNELRCVVTEQKIFGDEQRAVMTNCLLELHDQIRYIEQSSGNSDAGADTLHTILTEAMHINIQRLFKIVLSLLDDLQQADKDGEEIQIAHKLHSALSTLNSHLAFFMFNTNCTIILMLEDVFSRAARGELHIFSEILDMAREEIIHSMDNYRLCSSDGTCLRENSGSALKLQRIHDYIWAHESGSGISNPIEAFRHFMAGLHVEPELLKMLSPENVRDLMQTLEKGEQIYEILVHLESNESMTSAFLAWIESSGSRIITNRSLFIGDKSWYEMLMVSPLSRIEIQQSLATLDESGLFLSLKPWNSEIPEKETLLKSLEEVPELRQQVAAQGDLASNVIRVHGDALDNFMNLIGEMVLSRSRLNHVIHDNRLSLLISNLKQMKNGNNQNAAELLDMLEEHRRELIEADQLLHNSLGRLQECAVGLRVVPVEMVFKRLPRVVRDLSRSQGKHIRLEMTGQDVKIDKAMVEILTDPLLHMVRNSVDHGIETPLRRLSSGKQKEALIRVSALQRGNSIDIEISDDGAGIDTEKVLRKAVELGLLREEAGNSPTHEELLRFIFKPGFSTADAVTETSGRGVGMDVVMTNVMRMGGTISVDSEAGRGTKFTLKMPLSAAIQEVLMVEASGQMLALPGRYVAEVLEVSADDLQSVRGERAILLRGSFLPLHRLSGLLGYPSSGVERREGSAVVLTNGSQTIGLTVDKVVRRQELFVKDIQESVVALPGVGGASILGNGRVVLILDGEDLLRIAKSGVGRSLS